MKITRNHVAITIGVLSLMVYANSSILPDCIFGVKSVSFVLYTRSQPDGREIRMEDQNIPLHLNRKIYLLIHGFTSDANNTNYFDLAGGMLQQGDVNILSVDWRDGACSTGLSLTDLVSYESAVKNVPAVGEHVANFVMKLVREYRAIVPEIIVIGHSLGAHVAGFAGKNIQKLSGQKFGMIVGLDPAQPSFVSRSPADRLAIGDATFLEVFHTSHLGIHAEIGDNNYYFNEGYVQPECSRVFPSCSHSKAVEYLTSTIRHSPCFIGTQWTPDSKNIMNTRSCNPSICSNPGLNVRNQPARGSFYVRTTGNPPFCTA